MLKKDADDAVMTEKGHRHFSFAVDISNLCAERDICIGIKVGVQAVKDHLPIEKRLISRLT